MMTKYRISFFYNLCLNASKRDGELEKYLLFSMVHFMDVKYEYENIMDNIWIHLDMDA